MRLFPRLFGNRHGSIEPPNLEPGHTTPLNPGGDPDLHALPGGPHNLPGGQVMPNAGLGGGPAISPNMHPLPPQPAPGGSTPIPIHDGDLHPLPGGPHHLPGGPPDVAGGTAIHNPGLGGGPAISSNMHPLPPQPAPGGGPISPAAQSHMAGGEPYILNGHPSGPPEATAGPHGFHPNFGVTPPTGGAPAGGGLTDPLPHQPEHHVNPNPLAGFSAEPHENTKT